MTGDDIKRENFDTEIDIKKRGNDMKREKEKRPD